MTRFPTSGAAADGALREVPIMVLLVDDQPLVAEAVRHQLSADPEINFHYCSDAREAVPTARTIGPTVILLDLVLPAIDGLAILAALRAEPVTREVPVIVLSSREDAPTKAEAFAAGANDYLVKLPDPVETLARVRYHSAAYIARLQRDEAYRALRESQQKLEVANIELLRLVDVDGLTGLATRRHFDEVLAAEWRRAGRDRAPVSVLMADIDLFKAFNDAHGHLAGDECLRAAAGAVKACTRRSGDLGGRFGGEEFVVLLPGTEAPGALEVAEGLRLAVESLRIAHGASPDGPWVTLSVGVATLVPRPGLEASALVDLADQALYRAKSAGRNRVVEAPTPDGG